ncbi:hypothetical protein ABB37_06721 [Leptomonas pyrrhocoris]|uniref:Uncharacterized protein n=1 Tax=Leptomonas pyrrhocoris TaxID=157538 RepID=A0A0M9FX72_LEPPY|nr:hypothetical protein ABB37_06721 [Leptomonas pyrrhocoris]XP_015656390.1 hypothetical protein ABB37_06721 [Leptomonas pyrrhocoris]KPA77950.1 hypothetical protein ABB37_06721 [Leptomonas pyrrhocoris]KPA77951.1 hypothetical protein ABB37_06721 [Leptomonas pyrrhocoris]|eukprot:XP_015656389.1 hypothetical protein ABB37_06721 [Leptomonas pyrrhocoris]
MSGSARHQLNEQPTSTYRTEQTMTEEPLTVSGASSGLSSPTPPLPPTSSPDVKEASTSNASAAPGKVHPSNGSGTDIVEANQPVAPPPGTAPLFVSEQGDVTITAAEEEATAATAMTATAMPSDNPSSHAPSSSLTDAAAGLAEQQTAVTSPEASAREAGTEKSILMPARATAELAGTPKTPKEAAGATNEMAPPPPPPKPQPAAPPPHRHPTMRDARFSPPPPRGRSHNYVNNFSKNSDISCANFFFHGEDTTSFGVGTVGLYAVKAAATTTTTAAAAAAAAAAANTAAPASSGRKVQGMEDMSLTDFRDSANVHGQYTSPTLRRYQAATNDHPRINNGGNFLSAKSGAAVWDEREENYRQWKRRHLASSSYAQFSQLPTRNAAESDKDNDDGQHQRMFAMTVPATGGYYDFPELYSREAQMQLEKQRWRALEAERAAKAAAQAESKEKHAAHVLHYRARKLKGEAVDLPDAYLRATYPDPTSLSGYTIPSTARRTGPGSDDEEDVLDPQRVVKDHVRARQLHRMEQQQRHFTEEARRQDAAEKQRQTVSRQLEERQTDQRVALATWMSDRPRISRSRERQRHSEEDAEKRRAAQLNHSLRTQARELYACYAMEETAETTARQQELRKRVLTRLRSRRGQPPRADGQSSVHSNEQKETAPADGHLGAAATSRPSSPATSTSTTTATMPPIPAQVTAATATAVTQKEKDSHDVRPVTPTPPSQLVGPTSTNFFNEVKLWTQEFPSPNTAPVNAAEAQTRRAWKAELDEAHLQFNRETAQQQRELYPRRTLEARAKAREANWTRAERGRGERKMFAAKRADHTQTDLLSATAIRMELQEEAQLAQQQRQAQASERRDEVQFQRQLSKHREGVIHKLEAAELEQLRLVVSAHGNRA